MKARLIKQQPGSGCTERKRLLDRLFQTVTAVIEIQSSQVAALQLGDRQIAAFESEMDEAMSQWTKSRLAYMQHLLTHQCFSDGANTVSKPSTLRDVVHAPTTRPRLTGRTLLRRLDGMSGR